MKAVICVNLKDQIFMSRGTHPYIPLTIGKIYPVITHGKSLHSTQADLVVIENDNGVEQTYYCKSDKMVWFEDATPYLREQKLNELGI